MVGKAKEHLRGDENPFNDSSSQHTLDLVPYKSRLKLTPPTLTVSFLLVPIQRQFIAF
jgi:hypothetical protein